MLYFVSTSLIIMVGVLVSVHSHSVKLDNLSIWRAQKAALQEFKCQPRPRSFLVSAIFAHFKGDNDVIPSEMVLHRCDSQSGCCGNNGVCSETADGIEDVQMVFFSHKIQDIVVFQAKNHTRCSCQKENSGTI